MILPSLNIFNNSKLAPAPVEAEIVKAPIKDCDLYRRSIILGDDSTPKCQARLGMEKKLFSQTGDSTPIISALSGETFYDLQVASMLDGIVLEDTVMKTPVAAVVRFSKTMFQIYSTKPNYSGQQPVTTLLNQQPLYAHATVKQVGKVWHVILNTGSTFCTWPSNDPEFTIHQCVSHPSRHFATRHLLKQHGSTVASTQYGEGNSYMLQVNAGVLDPCLMICLAAIADETDKQQ